MRENGLWNDHRCSALDDNLNGWGTIIQVLEHSIRQMTLYGAVRPVGRVLRLRKQGRSRGGCICCRCQHSCILDLQPVHLEVLYAEGKLLPLGTTLSPLNFNTEDAAPFPQVCCNKQEKKRSYHSGDVSTWGHSMSSYCRHWEKVGQLMYTGTRKNRCDTQKVSFYFLCHSDGKCTRATILDWEDKACKVSDQQWWSLGLPTG